MGLLDLHILPIRLLKLNLISYFLQRADLGL